MKIMWGITGAGHLLKESMNELDKLSDDNTVTIALSKAGEEVINSYGYNNFLQEIKNKNKKNNIIKEDDEKYSYPISGKLTHNKYDYIIIAPTTANTTAKIVHGIADTLITNIVAQSGKGEIPTIIVPVDQKEGTITTRLPLFIDKNKCTLSPECNAKRKCPENAIKNHTIQLNKCIGCKTCITACKDNAVIADKKISLYIRHIDAENTKKLSKIENITVLFNPEKISKKIIKRD